MDKLFLLLQKKIMGNTLQNYLVFLTVFFGSMLLIRIFRRVIVRHIRSLAVKVDDYILDLFQKTVVPLAYYGAFYFAVNNLILSANISRVVNGLGVIILTIQSIRLGLALSFYFIRQSWFRRVDERKVRSVFVVIRIVAWGLGVVFVLANLGFNVSAVLAGLGIGGIAVALAAQTILGDLFNYFVIFFDKPFEEGDFIVIGEQMGEIERIGIKTTRLRSIGGEQLILSNTDLTSSRIRNFKRMERRRVMFKVGLSYNTAPVKLRKIPEMIKGIIRDIEGAVFERAHFQGFGDFSLNIEVVYYVMGSDYNKYMDIQEKINLGIKEGFEKEAIELASSAQTVYLNK